MKLLKFLLLSYLFFLSNTAAAGWTRKNVSTIVFEGDIDTASYNQYLLLSKENFTKVELKSFGGVPNIALKIATDLSSKNVEIIIDDYCFSACANYLAISGKKLEITCNALIGWHGSPGLETDDEIRKRFSKNNDPKELSNTYINWLHNFRAQEKAFFKKQNISPKLIEDSVIIPKKYIKEANNSTSFSFDNLTGEYSISRSQTASLWIPTKNILSEYGIQTDKFCNNYDEAHIKDLIIQKGFHFNYSTKAR